MAEQISQLADEELFENRLAKLDLLAAELKQAEQSPLGNNSQELEADPLARRRAQLAQLQALLDHKELLLEARCELTRNQRRRIANWLGGVRNALNQDRENFQRDSKRALQQLRRERAKCNKEREEFEELRCNLEANLTNGCAPPDAAQLAELQADRAALNARVQQLEHQLAETEGRLASMPSEADATHMDDMQRRFEMAIDDVRQLKHRNAELEEAIAEFQSEHTTVAPAEGTDWQTTKRRLMDEVEQDAEAERQNFTDEDRLTVEGAIRITDDIVAQRDQDIASLKKQLARQGDVREEGAEQLFNSDEIIRQERDCLAALKQELGEKLRKAEVELSVERAGLARQRAELQEKLRTLESDRDAFAAQTPVCQGTPSDKPKKPARRWLERMGLKELDQE